MAQPLIVYRRSLKRRLTGRISVRPYSREAMYYERAGAEKLRCLLCPHGCVLRVGESGRCRGRQNQNGKLIAVNYGLSIGVGLDPIEKKPLYHFRPGSQILSLGSNSCNLSCFFCQNYTSSQEPCPTSYLSPQDLKDLISQYAHNGLRQVAFTYTEPFTWYEYIYDFAQLAPECDIVLVTNGFVNPEPLRQLLPRIKALNIDLKSIRNEFYREHCQAALEPVKETIRSACAAGTHIELTNLLIPGLNDSDGEILDLAEFVASVDRRIPLHISAYHPAWRATLSATPSSAVLHACELASTKLDYVYAGNIQCHNWSETRCPNCQALLITEQRRSVGLAAAGRCRQCGNQIYGVFAC